LRKEIDSLLDFANHFKYSDMTSNAVLDVVGSEEKAKLLDEYFLK
jgi:hypothetical protein